MAKIVVVDDDAGVVDACRLFLEKEGHQVQSASNRDEGMRLIESESPDLLILDVMMRMPDDGIVMAQDLRKSGFEKPILMLTSVSKVTGMAFGKDESILPVDAFEEKPITPGALIAIVDGLLAGKEQGSCS